MIGWITEQDCRKVVLLYDKHINISLLGQECSIFLNRGSFHIRITQILEFISNPIIEHEAVTVIRHKDSGETASIYWSMYDKGYGSFRHVKFENGIISIGNSIDDDIYIQDKNLKPRQFIIKQSEHSIIDQYCSGIADLDGTIIRNNTYSYGSRMCVLNLQIVFGNHFLAVSSSSNTYCSLPDVRIPEMPLEASLSPAYLNRKHQDTVDTFRYEVVLEEPQPYENIEKRPLIFMIGPALMMSGAAFLTGMLSAYNAWLNGREFREYAPMIVLPSVMVLSVILWNPMQRIYENKCERKRKNLRVERYSKYLDHIKELIELQKSKYLAQLQNRFPANFNNQNELWRALPDQSDFLTIRVGTGEIYSNVVFKRAFRCSFEDPISELIANVEDKAATFRCPVLFSIKNYSRIAVLYDNGRKDLLIGLLFQLLFYHGPDVLRIAVLTSEEFENNHSWFRELPHVYHGNGSRMIAVSMTQAAEVAAEVSSANNMHWLIICFKQSLLTAFDQINCTVIYPLCNQSIPADAEAIIELKETGCIQTGSKVQKFDYDPLISLSIGEYLSEFRKWKLSSESLINKNVSFFDLYDVKEIQGLHISERWGKNRSADHLNAQIGYGDDGSPFVLDLDETGHGPHGLIAGMTGSGKSELIITLLLSLCVNYSPVEFQFVLIDFKGGGAASLFSNSTRRSGHIAGILSNLDESDTERALVSFQLECVRREQLFRDLSKLTARPIMNLKSYQNSWKEEYGIPYLPSLLIVVDEFAELKKDQPEVMRDLISIARVGRSLGIHMILATQKPAGIIDDQIWSNSRFKICLKVQDKADSNEMLHSDKASLIRRTGEGYFLCDGILSHLQCGYANAPLSIGESVIQLLDSMGHVVKQQEMKQKNKTVQSEKVIEEVFGLEQEYEPAHQLWCEPISSVSRSDLPAEHRIWLGIADNYKKRIQIPISLETLITAIFTIDREEKCRIMRTILAGIMECSDEYDQVFLIDDLKVFEESVCRCGIVCAHLTSRQDELTGNLISYLEQRDIHSKNVCTLIITDVSSFYEANETYQIRLRSLISRAEQKHLRLILCCNTVSVLSYRDLSLISGRIALKNDSIQELSAIFEEPIRHRIARKAYGICHCPELTDICLLDTTEKDLSKSLDAAVDKYGTEKRYVIPCMPETISYSSYEGQDYALGIALANYQWVTVPKDRRLMIIATYEEELYDYYRIMKNIINTTVFLPDQDAAGEYINNKGSEWIFMTMEQFQQYELKKNNYSILYIGTGFRDQYRFTARYHKDLQADQGILFQTGKNTILKLIGSE